MGDDENRFYKALLDGLYHGLFLGPTGCGKSKLVECLVRHLIRREDRPTIIVLDPGANTAKQLEFWAFKEGFRERLTILDPSEEGFYLGFNPLRRVPKLPLSLQAKFVQEAILTALELDQRDSVFYMPLLEKVLYFLAHLLIEAQLTFSEAPYLLTSNPNAQTTAIVERAETEMVRDFWLDTLKLKAAQRHQIFGVAQARLLPFITSQPIARMMGQRERALDFTEFIESGDLFLANVEAGSALSALDSKLLANLLISSVVKACFSRPAYTGKEVYLIIEECGEGLIGTEIGKMLRRARKQNLRVILLNQDISSMISDNPKVFWQIWSNANFKIAFGDLAMQDLEILALEFFGEELDLEEVKDEILRTYFEPRESSRTVYHSSSVDSYGEVEGEFSSASSGEVYLDEGLLLPSHETLYLSQGAGAGSSRASSSGHADVSGESTVPFYEFLKQQELSSRQFWAIEELLHRAKVKLKSLAKGTIALKRRGEKVEILKVPWIKNTPPPKDHGKLREMIFKKSDFYATIGEIEKEREDRAKAFKRSSEISIE